jgi:hypothetical protein
MPTDETKTAPPVVARRRGLWMTPIASRSNPRSMNTLAHPPAPVTAFEGVISGLLAAGCRVAFAGWAPCEAPAEHEPTGPAAADDIWLAEDNARRAAAAEEMARVRYDELVDELYAERSGQAYPDWPGAEMVAATGAHDGDMTDA